MNIHSFASADAVAHEAALYIAQAARKAIFDHGRFTFAISGGRTPWEMLKFLSKEKLAWEKIFIFQVDERIAPDGHPDRNLTQFFKTMEGSGLMTRVNVFPMPVTQENLEEACMEYSETIAQVKGEAPFDLIHLGMGADGHTASLVPNDPICEVKDKDIAITTNLYQGRLRMSVTYPFIAKAKEIMWVITGEEKREMYHRFLDGDESIPAGKISKDNAVVFTDL